MVFTVLIALGSIVTDNSRSDRPWTVQQDSPAQSETQGEAKTDTPERRANGLARPDATQHIRAPDRIVLWMESGLKPQPSDTSPIIQWIAGGTRVRWISKVKAYYEIEYDGRIGYVKEDLVDPEYRRATTLKNSVPRRGAVKTWRLSGLRSQPSLKSNIIEWIPEDVTLRVHSTLGTFYKVSYKGKVGFIGEDLIYPAHRYNSK